MPKLTNEEIEEIRIKKTLDRKGEVLGLLPPDDDVIYLRQNKNVNIMTKILVHEVLHFLHEDSPEREILRLEDLLWSKFSKKQKMLLKFYLTHLARWPKSN